MLTSLLIAGLASSCTVTHVRSHSGPARIESHGLIEGHAAVGILSEDRLLEIDVFDGSSDGAFFEFGLWKLLRLELGLAGASASVGPLHVGLGVLAYEPIVPRMSSDERTAESEKADSCGLRKRRNDGKTCEVGDGCFEEDDAPAECPKETPSEVEEAPDSHFEVDPSLVTED